MKPRPILRLKAWAAGKFAARIVRRQLRRTPEGREAEKIMKEFLDNKKELITWALGGLATLLPMLGLAEWAPFLSRIQAAVQAGDVMATIAAFVALIVFAAGFFGRLGKNRQHAEVVAKLDAVARR